jgi:hypothetical protein
METRKAYLWFNPKIFVRDFTGPNKPVHLPNETHPIDESETISDSERRAMDEWNSSDDDEFSDIEEWESTD